MSPHLPDSLFLITILHVAWLVISLKGVRFVSLVDLASIFRVCHSNSLKMSSCPLLGSFNLVILKSAFSHFGDLDSNKMREI